MGIIFEISHTDEQGAFGKLLWPDQGLESLAVSGPYSRGELQFGLYHCYRNKLLDKDNAPPFCDSLQNCWMQVITPQFSTNRTELGIHPDGNRMGTKGCIGIIDANTASWFSSFYSIPQNSYTTLEVY